MVAYIAIAVIAYLIGSINFSVIFSKKMAGFDVREKGSGNAGTTNVLRTVGKKAAAIKLIVMMWPNLNGVLLIELAAISVILGHTFPIFFKFKGGKGVATSLGVLLTINWQIGLICLVFALVLIALTQMVSVGSIAAAVLYPVLTIFIHQNYIVDPGTNMLIYIAGSIILAIIVVFNHRSNVKRLLSGTENKISFKSVK